MPNFVRKRLQVFVSSTYTDLKEERQAAVEAILTAGHIPAGMELFTAGDESQMDVIKRWIDESDVYLLILGGRYGSLEPKTVQSYIELEYRYALDQRKPLFACAINDAALEQRVRQHGSGVLERENPLKLKEFRAFVLTRMVRFWDDYKDIKITIGETLFDFARRDDLVGWVRGDQGANPAVTDELARLSKENAELRSRLAAAEVHQPLILGLTYSELVDLLVERELLDYLLKYRQRLGSGLLLVSDVDPKKCSELAAIGLISNLNDGAFRLTDAGRIFLNRVEIETLGSDGPVE